MEDQDAFARPTPDPLALAPCPFCGAGKIRIHTACISAGLPSRAVHHAACYGCGAQGQQADRAAEAIAAWNRRALSAPVQGPVDLPEGWHAMSEQQQLAALQADETSLWLVHAGSDGDHATLVRGWSAVVRAYAVECIDHEAPPAAISDARRTLGDPDRWNFGENGTAGFHQSFEDGFWSATRVTEISAPVPVPSAPVQGPVDQQVNAKGLLPCPFCGSSKIDPEGWSCSDGREGPVCEGCSASADSVDDWNRRVAISAAPVQGVPEGLAALKRGNLAFTSRGPVHSISITWQSQEDRDSAYHGLIKSMVKGETSPEPPAPVAVSPSVDAPVLPKVCDGKEQDAFEAWAKGAGYDATTHPLHWLFLDAKTASARDGWKAAIEYVNATVQSSAPSVDAEAWRAGQTAAADVVKSLRMHERDGRNDAFARGDSIARTFHGDRAEALAEAERRIRALPAPSSPASTGEPVLPAPLRVGAAVFGRGVKLETVQGAIDRATGREETGLPEIKPHPEGALVFRETVEPELADLAQAGQFRCSTCGGSGHVDDAAASTGETIERAAQALCEHGADIPRAVLGVKWSVLAERFPPVAELYRQMARVVLSAASTGEAETLWACPQNPAADPDPRCDAACRHTCTAAVVGRAETAERQLAEALRERDEARAALEQIGASPALMAIAAERRRQVKEEGWTAEHDDQHADGDLPRTAACYALSAAGYPRHDVAILRFWPWLDGWKPSDPRRDLEWAGALTAAALERLDRAEARALSQQGGQQDG